MIFPSLKSGYSFAYIYNFIPSEIISFFSLSLFLFIFPWRQLIPYVSLSDRAGNTQKQCFMQPVNCLPAKKGPQVGRWSWLFWLNHDYPSGGKFPLQTPISTNILRHKPATLYIHCLLISFLHRDLGCAHFGEGWVHHVVIPEKLDFLNRSNIELCIKLIGVGRAWFENPPRNKEKHSHA